MIFNKIKNITLGLLLSSLAFVSCSDDDGLLSAPRLFRPIAEVSTYENSITVKWDLIKSAKAYQLVLSTDSFKTATQTVETTDPSYVFDELGWDEKYQIRIKAISNNEDTNDSEFFDCEETQITYPTKLQKVTDVIDVAARVQWKEAVDYTAFEIQKSVDGKFQAVDTVLVKDKERTNLQKVIYGLEPETSYRVIAYTGTSESYQYEGRQAFKTEASEDFGANVVDLRNLTDEEAIDTINTDFLKKLEEGTVVVLQGGFEYNLSSTVTISKSVKFITGLSLSGNAIFKTGGFVAATGSVANIEFNKVDFITSGDKNASNFGGKYIFNQGNQSSIGNLKFINCSIRYMRGIVRLQSKPSIIDNVTIENCVMDSIGGYGVLNCDVAGSQIKAIAITNSTIAHAEKTLVNSKSQFGFQTINITDCTFAYCSKGTNKIFDFGTKAGINDNLQFNAQNILFGPSFDGAATNGVTCLGTDSKLSFTNCYKTADLLWITNETGAAVSPLPSVEEYSKNSTDLWNNPTMSDFSIKDAGFAGAKNTGDPRWR